MMQKRTLVAAILTAVLLTCFVFLVAGCSDKGTGPQDGVLTGHVYREGTIQPIYMAKVSCAGITVFSDHEGSYELTGLPLGWQTLVVNKEEFKEYREQVNITKNATGHDVHIAEVKDDNGGNPEG